MDDLQFHPASPEQAGEITSLVNSVYRGDNAKKGWTTEAEILGGIRITQEKVKEYINTDNNVILLALHEEKIIGCVHLEKEGNFCWLGMLSVDVNYQTYGLGKMLIEKSESYVKNNFGCDEMKMKVIGVRKELLEYYFRRGYKLTGEREDFIIDEDTFGKPFVQGLYFEILSKKLG
jgi:GNAT superfamily N-acetyltransferase